MPWTNKTYPDSMKNLPKEVREKAIEIANAMLEETNANEGIVIATAISRAKDWAVNHGKTPERKAGRKTDVKKHGEDRYVIPKEKGWAVKKEASKKVEKAVPGKKEAIQLATKKAKKANASVIVLKKTGQVQKRKSYNPRKTTKKIK